MFEGYFRNYHVLSGPCLITDSTFDGNKFVEITDTFYTKSAYDRIRHCTSEVLPMLMIATNRTSSMKLSFCSVGLTNCLAKSFTHQPNNSSWNGLSCFTLVPKFLLCHMINAPPLIKYGTTWVSNKQPCAFHSIDCLYVMGIYIITSQTGRQRGRTLLIIYLHEIYPIACIFGRAMGILFLVFFRGNRQEDEKVFISNILAIYRGWTASAGQDLLCLVTSGANMNCNCCGYAIVHNEFTWSIFPYSTGLLCWHWGNR